jgi:hypothetical protein
LLRKLVDSDVTGREDRDPIGAVDRVVAERVAADDCGIELTAADDDDLVAPQVITRSGMALLHPSIVSPHRPRSAAASSTSSRWAWVRLPRTVRVV